jgi:hypothetical protein
VSDLLDGNEALNHRDRPQWFDRPARAIRESVVELFVPVEPVVDVELPGIADTVW